MIHFWKKINVLTFLIYVDYHSKKVSPSTKRAYLRSKWNCQTIFAYYLEYIFSIHENRKIFLFGHRDHSLGKLTEVLCDICWYFRRFAQLKFPASASHTTPLLTSRQSLAVCIPTNIVNDPWVELRNSATKIFLM